MVADRTWPEANRPSLRLPGIDYPSPAWHGKVLASRSEIIESGKATWLSLDVSLDELQARLLISR